MTFLILVELELMAGKLMMLDVCGCGAGSLSGKWLSARRFLDGAREMSVNWCFVCRNCGLVAGELVSLHN
jgi:hypothetical protein